MATANENIRDDLIAHDIDLRRVSTGVARDVNRRLSRMNADLRALLARIDPGGTQRQAARDRRLKRVEILSLPIIEEAYRDINQMVRSDLRRVGRAETVVVANAINTALP